MFCLRIVDKAVVTLADVPGPNPPAAIVTAFIQLLLSVQLLFYICHSRLFKMYLKLLSTLQIPVEGRVRLYCQAFAKFAAWHTHHVHNKRLMEDLTPSQPHPEPVDDEAVDEVLVDCLLRRNRSQKTNLTCSSEGGSWVWLTTLHQFVFWNESLIYFRPKQNSISPSLVRTAHHYYLIVGLR